MQKFFKLILVHWDLVILGLLILIYVITLSWFSILRHNAFSSNFDLANVDQTIWNTLHGRIFTMSTQDGNTSRLGTHADFILILLTPFYLIWDNVRILLIIQSAFLGLGAMPVYFLTKKILGGKIIPLILVSVYLVDPAMQWTNIYDFHGVALAIPFLLATFFLAYTKNWKWYWVFFMLSLITKEEISLLLAIIGIIIWLVWKNWKVGLASILIGVIWFPVMVFFFIPHFNQNGQHWAFNDWFSPVKTDLSHSDFSHLLNTAATDAIRPNRLNYYYQLLKPFGYLPLLGFPWLIIAGPELLINIISSNPGMQTITLHYTSGIIPFLIISTIFGLKYLGLILTKLLKLFKKPPRYQYYLLTISTFILLLIALQSDYQAGPLPISISCPCSIYKIDSDDLAFEKLLQSIPKDASVAASNEVRPHLTHRENAYNLPTIPKNTEYIAIIDENRVVGNNTPHDFEVPLTKNLSVDKSYQLVSHINHFYLFKKD